MTLFIPPVVRALDTNADPITGAVWYFYESETTTPAPVYTDETYVTSLGFAIEAAAGGLFPTCYLDPTIVYRAILKDADGATIRDIDPINGFSGRSIATVEDMAEINAPEFSSVYLGEEGREGMFVSRPTEELDADAISEDTEQGIFVPYANGGAYHWVRTLERIRPTYFGEYTGSNGHTLLQAALLASARHNRVVELDRMYEGTQMLWTPDNAVVVGIGEDAGYENTILGSEAIKRSAWAFGTYHPFYMGNTVKTATYQNTDSSLANYTTEASLVGTTYTLYEQYLDWDDCLAANEGDTTLRLASAADKSKYPAGTKIFVRDSRYYYSGGGQIPFQLLPAIVVGDNWDTLASDTIELSHPLLRGITTPQIAISNPSTAFSTGATLVDNVLGMQMHFCAYPILENISIVSRYGHPFSAYSAVLEPKLRGIRTRGRTGYYMNCAAHGYIEISKVDCWWKVFECALGGGNMDVKIGQANYRKIDTTHIDTTVAVPVMVNENTIDYRLDIQGMALEGFDYASQVAIICRATQGARIRVGNLSNPDSVGYQVGAVNTLRAANVDTGETQSPTKDIDIMIDRANGGANMLGYVSMNDDGGELQRVTIDGTFLGTLAVWQNTDSSLPSYTTTTSLLGTTVRPGVSMAGERVTIRGYCDDGSISLAGTTTAIVNVRGAPGGIEGLTTATTPGGIDVDGAPYQGGYDAGQQIALTVTYTPDLTYGKISPNEYYHSFRFKYTEASDTNAVTIAAPTGGNVGDFFKIKIKNGNQTTSVTPSFNAVYTGLPAISAITAALPSEPQTDNYSTFIFYKSSPTTWSFFAAEQNVTP